MINSYHSSFLSFFPNFLFFFFVIRLYQRGSWAFVKLYLFIFYTFAKAKSQHYDTVNVTNSTNSNKRCTSLLDPSLATNQQCLWTHHCPYLFAPRIQSYLVDSQISWLNIPWWIPTSLISLPHSLKEHYVLHPSFTSITITLGSTTSSDITHLIVNDNPHYTPLTHILPHLIHT